MTKERQVRHSGFVIDSDFQFRHFTEFGITMNRVVITGIGWITPLGMSIEEVWKRLLAGESGVAKTTLFDATTFPTSISAEVKGFKFEEHVSDLEKHRDAGRNTKIALAACSQAWKQSGLDSDKLDLDRVGIYLGSGEGPIDVDALHATPRSVHGTVKRRSWTFRVGAESAQDHEPRRRDGAGAEHAARPPGDHDRARGPA